MTNRRTLESIAHRYAFVSGDQYDADDLSQSLQEWALSHAGELHDKNESWVRRRLFWEAAHTAERGRTYRAYVAAMPLVEDGDGEITELFELLPAPGDSPEQALLAEEEADEQAAAAALWLDQVAHELTEAQAELLRLLRQGLSQSEAARQLDVSAPNVSLMWQRIVAHARRLTP